MTPFHPDCADTGVSGSLGGTVCNQDWNFDTHHKSPFQRMFFPLFLPAMLTLSTLGLAIVLLGVVFLQ